VKRAAVLVGAAIALAALARVPREPTRFHHPGPRGVALRATQTGPRGTLEESVLLERARVASDAVSRIEAIDALVARGDVAFLDDLLIVDPADDPFVAPTVIEAIAAIGRNAPRAAKDRAARRLASMLASEKERRGQDSAGNVVSIVEAIGNLGHPAAASALEAELDDAFHDTAGKTNIVEALAKTGARSSIPALKRLRDRAPAEHATGYDRELERELAQAIDTAIMKLL
jgi:hypothetical protein